jgi:hypothetical protein
MYNRATAELAEQVKAWEARERGNNLSRSEMLQRQARRVRSEAAKTASFHGRVETWLTGKAADVEAGERPPSPSYQTKNHAAHHRFRDRDPSKELGPMRCDPRAACLPPTPLLARALLRRLCTRLLTVHAHCHRMSAKHYTIPGGLHGTQGSYLATARIAMNHTKTLESFALCQEAYQQTNELPSHAKYSMRRRQKQKELHAPLRFGDASEAERIHNATLRDQVCVCVCVSHFAPFRSFPYTKLTSPRGTDARDARPVRPLVARIQVRGPARPETGFEHCSAVSRVRAIQVDGQAAGSRIHRDDGQSHAETRRQPYNAARLPRHEPPPHRSDCLGTVQRQNRLPGTPAQTSQ